MLAALLKEKEYLPVQGLRFPPSKYLLLRHPFSLQMMVFFSFQMMLFSSSLFLIKLKYEIILPIKTKLIFGQNENQLPSAVDSFSPEGGVIFLSI